MKYVYEFGDETLLFFSLSALLISLALFPSIGKAGTSQVTTGTVSPSGTFTPADVSGAWFVNSTPNTASIAESGSALTIYYGNQVYAAPSYPIYFTGATQISGFGSTASVTVVNGIATTITWANGVVYTRNNFSFPNITGVWSVNAGGSATISVLSGPAVSILYGGQTYPIQGFTSATQLVGFGITATVTVVNGIATTITWTNGVVYTRPPNTFKPADVSGAWFVNSTPNTASIAESGSALTIYYGNQVYAAPSYPIYFTGATQISGFGSTASVTVVNGIATTITWANGVVYTRNNFSFPNITGVWSVNAGGSATISVLSGPAVSILYGGQTYPIQGFTSATQLVGFGITATVTVVNGIATTITWTNGVVYTNLATPPPVPLTCAVTVSPSNLNVIAGASLTLKINTTGPAVSATVNGTPVYNPILGVYSASVILTQIGPWKGNVTVSGPPPTTLQANCVTPTFNVTAPPPPPLPPTPPCTPLPPAASQYGINAFTGGPQPFLYSVGADIILCNVPGTGAIAKDCSIQEPMVCAVAGGHNLVAGSSVSFYSSSTGLTSPPNGTMLRLDDSLLSLEDIPHRSTSVFGASLSSGIFGLSAIKSFLPNGAQGPTISVSDSPYGYDSINGGTKIAVTATAISVSGTDPFGNKLSRLITETNNGAGNIYGYVVTDASGSSPKTRFEQVWIGNSWVTGDQVSNLGYAKTSVGRSGNYQVVDVTFSASLPLSIASISPTALSVSAGGGTITVTDPKYGTTHSTTYDKDNHVISETGPGTSAVNQFGPTGLLQSSTSTRGTYQTSTSYQYNPANGQYTGDTTTAGSGSIQWKHSTTYSGFTADNIPTLLQNAVNGIVVSSVAITAAPAPPSGVPYIGGATFSGSSASTPPQATFSTSGNTRTVKFNDGSQSISSSDSNGMVTQSTTTLGGVAAVTKVTGSVGTIPLAGTATVTVGNQTYTDSSTVSVLPDETIVKVTARTGESATGDFTPTGASITATLINASVSNSVNRTSLTTHSNSSETVGGFPLTTGGTCSEPFPNGTMTCDDDETVGGENFPSTSSEAE